VAIDRRENGSFELKEAPDLEKKLKKQSSFDDLPSLLRKLEDKAGLVPFSDELRGQPYALLLGCASIKIDAHLPHVDTSNKFQLDQKQGNSYRNVSLERS